MFFPKIAIFIPTYNEGETIGKILEKLPPEILGWSTEIVIVDDASTDNTVDIVQRYTERIIKCKSNRGVGAATKAGFEYIAKMSDVCFVIKLDGDGQHVLHLLPEIVAHLQEGADLVVCSRFHPESDQRHTPTDRILLNMIFTEMLRKITGWKLTDVRSGYMGMQFDYVKTIASQLIVERYGIPMEIILRIWHENPGAALAELPHPALYGPNISKKLAEKYSREEVVHKTTRLDEAYAALLKVIEDLKVPRERILEMNGFLLAGVGK